MNHAQAIVDMVDALDRTPFGDMEKALNELAEQAARNLRMHEGILRMLRCIAAHRCPTGDGSWKTSSAAFEARNMLASLKED